MVPAVLVLEDDPVQAEYAIAVLKACAVMDVKSVGSAFVALEELSVGRWDILLCDLNLPDMDGISIIHELARLEFQPKVIFTTMLDARLLRSAGHVAKNLFIDVIGMLEKPIKMKALKKVLEDRNLVPLNGCGVGGRQFSITESSVREALQEGKIQPWFQPQICCRTGAILGVEALARWLEPSHGILPPAVFMQTILEKNMDGELAIKMLENSLVAQDKWKKEGLNVSISINLSTSAMSQSSIVQSLLDTTSAFRGERQGVVFELTENLSDGMKDSVLFENLAELRMSGFGLAIDDFGIGFSSLARLSNIPFTELKIDKSFVNGVPHHPHQRAIVESMISLAHQLRMYTVAEGVEAAEHSDLLCEIGCDRMQGFLYGTPMPEWQLLSFCRARNL